MSGREKVIAKLQEFGISPKRSLGQNFLVSDIVIDKIIASASRLDVDQIIEIGPGLGALTEKLMTLEKAFKVVELDRTFSEHWRNQGVEVIESDALKVDWSQIVGAKKTAIVSNLPYQISSRLVVEISVGEVDIQSMILMFQKEVAERMTAKPSTEDYGLLTVIAQSFWDIDLVTNAGMQDFYPAPQVGSRVLRFKSKAGRRAELLNDGKGLYLTLVKAAFAQRRKFLIKNLAALGQAVAWDKVFDSLKLPRDIRAEALSVDQYRSLYAALRS